jgi:hypothetical protein
VIEQTYRNITKHVFGSMELPVEKVDPFPARYGGTYVTVIGRFGAFYAAEPPFGAPALYPLEQVHKLETTERFCLWDRVEFNGEFGTILALTDSSALFLSDGRLVDAKPPETVPLDQVNLIGTMFGRDGGRPVPESPAAVPGDLFVGPEGFVTFCRSSQGEEVARNQAGHLIPFKIGDNFLVRRAMPVGWASRTLVRGNAAFGLSLSLHDMAGTGLMQGDEVALPGDIRAVVLGFGDDYLWLSGFDGQITGVLVLQADTIRLISRPISDPVILHRILTAQ